MRPGHRDLPGLDTSNTTSKSFLAKYVAQDKLQKQADEAKMRSWVSLFKYKFSWCLNPEVPTLTPWKITNPINTPQRVLERNPYYLELIRE